MLLTYQCANHGVTTQRSMELVHIYPLRMVMDTLISNTFTSSTLHLAVNLDSSPLQNSFVSLY